MVTFVESSITRDYKGVWEVLILMQYYPGELEGLVPVRARGGGGGVEVEWGGDKEKRKKKI